MTHSQTSSAQTGSADPLLVRARTVVYTARGLVRPLWLRERRDRWLAALLALAVAAALGTTAYAYALDIGQGTDRSDALQQGMLFTGGFRSTIGVIFAIIAVLVPIDRLAAIRSTGWCLPLVARGTSPASIVLGAMVTFAAGVLGAFTTSYVVFGLAMALLHLSPLRPLLLGYAATAPALIAWTSFGTLAGVLARGRGAAVAVAATAIVIPSLLVTIWTVTQGQAPPTWAMWLWAAIAPVPLHVASWHLFAERVRYVACAALLIGLLSRRWLVPYE